MTNKIVKGYDGIRKHPFTREMYDNENSPCNATIRAWLRGEPIEDEITGVRRTIRLNEIRPRRYLIRVYESDLAAFYDDFFGTSFTSTPPNGGEAGFIPNTCEGKEDDDDDHCDNAERVDD